MRRSSKKWCGINVIIENTTTALFEMSAPNEEPDQQPAFLVTQSTANLVALDFERYCPSLERMIENWRVDKARYMEERAVDEEGRLDAA